MNDMRIAASLAAAALLLGAFVQPTPAQELPLAPVRGADQGVWPVFEGWYDNGDGTYTIYFGFHNENADEVVDIPLGENNFIEPAQYDGGQPTSFPPLRDWGVFGINVPSTLSSDAKIYWTLVTDGKAHRIPGHLQPEWKTDALGGGAMGNTPPVLSFGSVSGSGPAGVSAAPVRATVGRPVRLSVHASDEAGEGPDLAALFLGGGEEGGPRVTLDWLKHQGPGEVRFDPPSGRVLATGGELATMATFSEPGEYVVRVRATDGPLDMSGHAQCCWSNGYVPVTVTR
jgi:hypothetical protein